MFSIIVFIISALIALADCIIAYCACVISHKYSVIEEEIETTRNKIDETDKIGEQMKNIDTDINIDTEINADNNDVDKSFNVEDKMIVAVDFDNTIAVTEYPKIIKPIDVTIHILRQAKKLGATIILWTCREGKELEEAVNWCRENNVPIDYVNENVPERIEKWGNDCRKIGADVYIDDRSINPLMWLNKGVIK